MFFSVVVPVYNVEKYLRECIESFLCQTFTDFEMILVNDGSTDNSGLICDEYAEKDSRIKVLHKQNGGMSDARNKGTEMASGKYVVYIDSDDYVSSSEFLMELFEKAESDPDIIVYKFKKYFEDSKRFSKCAYAFPELNTMPTLADKISYIVKSDAFYCSAWSKTMKLSLLKDNRITFEKGLMAEDQEWYYHVLLNANTLEGIDKDYIVYRQRANSVSSSTKVKNITDCIDVVDKWQKEISSNAALSPDYKEALLGSVAKLYCNALVAYTNCKDKTKKDHYKRLKSLSFLFKYNINPRVSLFSKVYRIAGFDITMMALKIICKVR